MFTNLILIISYNLANLQYRNFRQLTKNKWKWPCSTTFTINTKVIGPYPHNGFEHSRRFCWKSHNRANLSLANVHVSKCQADNPKSKNWTILELNTAPLHKNLVNADLIEPNKNCAILELNTSPLHKNLANADLIEQNKNASKECPNAKSWNPTIIPTFDWSSSHNNSPSSRSQRAKHKWF